MASNKDILDAQRFNRRRLVTAFVAGAPGGRELEPRRITPPLIGGIVLTLVIALASWISGMFVGSLPSDWQNNTLIVVKGEGTRYITVDGRLRPVTNLASARLLAESGKFRQTTLKSSVLDGIERGSRVGIEDAPEQLPATGSLTAHGWTACSTSEGRTAVGVGASPKGLSTIQHALVSVDGRTYLVADGVSHELPADNLGSVLLALGLDSEPITEADATWLSLFTPGSMLQSLTVPDAGTPVTGLSSTIKNPVAGMLLSVTDSAGGQRHYIAQARVGLDDVV
ncbi:MAG: type VII secretion protein EccB, partial [Actinomyces sp.]